MVQRLRRQRRKFTPEFKAEAVRLCSEPGRSICKVAKNLDLNKTVLRAWVRQAAVDTARGRPGALSTAERQELSALRYEIPQLRMEREILRKATAFFAKEQM